MSKSVPVKFLAFLLTSLAVTAVCACSVAILFLTTHHLYTEDPEDRLNSKLDGLANALSTDVLDYYCSTELATGDEVPLERYRQMYSHIYGDIQDNGLAYYQILDESGTVVSGSLDKKAAASLHSFSLETSSSIPVITQVGSDLDMEYEAIYRSQWSMDTYDEILSDEVLSDDTDDSATVFQGVARSENCYIQYCDTFQDNADQLYRIYYLDGPTLTIQVWLQNDVLSNSSWYWSAVDWLYTYRFSFIAGFLASLLLSAVGIVYLCLVAGKSPSSPQIRLVGLNRLPLDLYLLLTGSLVFIGLLITLRLGNALEGLDYGIAVLAGVTVQLASLSVILFLYAFAAQSKMGQGYWWKHTITGRLLRWCRKSFRALFRMIPLVWQWILIAGLMAFCYGFALLFAASTSSILPLLFVIALCIGIVCYGAYSFGTLLRGAREMARGDLRQQISTHHLIGNFRTCAEDLNKLADVAVVAAKTQMQSERMKTELITNVSHDIKTPLTSIINFVDLLQKPHTNDEEAQYLDVLSRQSQRLKRLIEDLIDLSKASTGNMTANLTEMDAVEVVNQALGEYGDKLAEHHLIPVFREPEIPARILADGRLAWRVLSNLLTNAVKYALPDTRLYVDVVPLEGKVLISIKNISREQISVSAEELMERFVRGDTARNTEGNGLGLNIARSLMEVQHGQLQLLVDGDLFKVTLLFPSP